MHTNINPDRQSGLNCNLHFKSMATTNQHVTAEGTLSATVRYSNRDDASRKYDITANVNLQHNQVNPIENGEVRKLQSGESGQMGEVLATFSSYSGRSLNLGIQDADEEGSKQILATVTAFIGEVKSKISAIV